MREWIKLGLPLVAGGSCIWPCSQSSFSSIGNLLLFSFCLILLGRANQLMLLRLERRFSLLKLLNRMMAARTD